MQKSRCCIRNLFFTIFSFFHFFVSVAWSPYIFAIRLFFYCLLCVHYDSLLLPRVSVYLPIKLNFRCAGSFVYLLCILSSFTFNFALNYSSLFIQFRWAAPFLSFKIWFYFDILLFSLSSIFKLFFIQFSMFSFHHFLPQSRVCVLMYLLIYMIAIWCCRRCCEISTACRSLHFFRIIFCCFPRVSHLECMKLSCFTDTKSEIEKRTHWMRNYWNRRKRNSILFPYTVSFLTIAVEAKQKAFVEKSRLHIRKPLVWLLTTFEASANQNINEKIWLLFRFEKRRANRAKERFYRKSCRSTKVEKH